jgi:hypothetical protein
MSARELRFTPLNEEDFARLKEEDECFFSREQLAKRWRCSEKSVLRAEKRLGLRPYRLLRGIRYKLTDIMRVEAEALKKMPKKFTGLRPDQKAELRRREREEISQPTRPLKIPKEQTSPQ